MSVRPPRRLRMVPAAAALALALGVAAPGGAQERASLRLAAPGGTASRVVEVARHRGYAAVPAATLAALGWDVRSTARGVRATSGDAVVDLVVGDPFFSWGDELLQLVDEPYRFGDDVWIPVQLLVDFLPSRLADAYAFDADPPTLRVLEEGIWSTGEAGEGRALPTGSASATAPGGAPRDAAPTARGWDPAPRSGASTARSADAASRVVVIDAGHGGGDPGAMGAGGLREKNVALAVALALAEELRGRPGLEVHLTRDDDRLVPIWGRGQWATDVKGTRPGVFISLHANAVSRRDARGFETYFLSEARTEHERRVAALENAPLALEGDPGTDGGEEGLGFILKELRNLDHAHWSEFLAGLIQDRMAPIHPGPNRGVKQAPLAVITNALMPAVLVELGFITNREEERVLGRASFQADAARALADAVVAFFERYPPGGAGATGGRDP